MTARPDIRRWIGAAVALLLVLLVTDLSFARPEGAGMFDDPQVRFWAYDRGHLAGFFGELRDPDIYRAATIYLDTIFIVLLALWLYLHGRRRRGVARWALFFLAAAYAVADFGENLALLRVLDSYRDGAGADATAGAGRAAASWWTTAKWAALVGAVLAVLIPRRGSA